MGTFERVLGFGLVYFHVDAAPTLLALWIGAKFAANWQRREVTLNDTEREIRVQTFVALMTGMLSVTIGAAAGEIARQLIPPTIGTWMGVGFG